MLKFVESSPNNLCMEYFFNNMTWLENAANPVGFSPSGVSTVIFPVPTYLSVDVQSFASRRPEYDSKLSLLLAK
ncbi:hypothetical protein D1872_231460 [compost metagenome]